MIVKPLNLQNLDYLMLNINVYFKENKNSNIKFHLKQKMKLKLIPLLMVILDK